MKTPETLGELRASKNARCGQKKNTPVKTGVFGKGVCGM
jgi:hypothetical protein